MNMQLLIDSIVRHTTVLIAQLATAGGSRTPLADVAGQVFVDLARELERQGVSRKVAADMFGLALRTYRRRIQRFAESRTVQGRSLWEAVNDFVALRHLATRAQVLDEFHLDDEALVASVLSDLVESGLVYRAGRGSTASYRAATRADLDYVRDPKRDADGTDTLVWGLVYRFGPIDERGLAQKLSLPAKELSAALGRLLGAKRVQLSAELAYHADGFVVPVGTPLGWEAAVSDHFGAVVTTICQKLATDTASGAEDAIGGSTYTLEVWPGHPFEKEALSELSTFRQRISDLRRRVAEHNRQTTLPERRTRVVIYGGQHVLSQEETEDGLET
jgi:hypothetical protein